MKKVQLTVVLIGAILFASCTDNSAKLKKLNENITNLESKIEVQNKEQATLEANKKVVTDFYQDLFGNQNYQNMDKYVGPVYIQHNPNVADGREALKEMLPIWLKDAPKFKLNFNLVVAEKDLVFVQVITENDGNRTSTMDVFRVTDGKISEHWDAFNTFKKGDKSANDNPLF
ncbi:ester cyclase [Maribacter sp. BPC-D8]|uniref:nuclear transport factor 2 family protein n=1 Tax=Maribacter sp. BPC-D8 TaxID=3053613 RepID=UPI002B492C57|nr:ester cyclase [Maribacter sp. BPC-D8]WRI30653.1 ester cyclase [Maribacter sp. BPC-D8]